MKASILFAVFAGLTLVSAAPPGSKAITTADAVAGYPPCSATVTDRCIQLYERGVRAAKAAPAKPAAVKPAQGGPYESASTAIMSPDDYPVCSRSVTDRCVQRATRRAAPSYARQVRRAGERG